MESWSFEELRELCREKGLSEEIISKFSKFATSLDWRYARAKFHGEQADKIWKDLFAQSFTFGDEKYSVAEFSYEAYVEACIQSLHSMGDILGQIINIILLGEHFSEDQVSLYKVTEFMINNGIAPDIIDEINKLICSDEFCYVDAFCNTIKHRRIIKSQFNNEYKDKYYKLGLVFNEFHYRNRAYPETWGDDIIEKFRKHIISKVIGVGLKINNFVKEI